MPGGAATPAAHPEDVRVAARGVRSLTELDSRITACRACPRLVTWREQVAATRRRSFATETYWGRPVPGFGDEHPAILIVGLAPAAHGGNRTGRVFTGDRSGDWLVAALHRAGLASAPQSRDATDGLVLDRTRMLAAVRCAPPDNRPTPGERDTCAPWLDAELGLVWSGLRVLVALGGFAWSAALGALSRRGVDVGRPAPRFAHRGVVHLDGRALVGSYHPSQQNTFTGRLTEAMLDDVLALAVREARPSTGT
ncbi:MAG: uracil-DNA glycosylase [Actinomycetes bacterium]